MGLQLASAILLGLFLGYQADKKWGTSPWLLFGGVLLGSAAGFYSFIREVLKKDG